MRCRCEGEDYHFSGHVVDISFGGAGISGTKPWPAEGTDLLVLILLPWRKIELPSRVVWTKSRTKKRGLADFGVEFLGSLSERQNKLAEFFPKANTLGG